MPTLLDLLTAPNVDRIMRATRGPNTRVDWAPNWTGQEARWPEFNYNTLVSIYQSHLDKNCDKFVTPEHSDFDREILNENSLDHFLTRFNLPVVNRALSLSSRKGLHLGLGSRSWTKLDHMDWSLVSSEDPGSSCPYKNLLPGESKLHVKWNMELKAINFTEWRMPIDQIMAYMVAWERRYGFIITDQYLYVFRITELRVGRGIARDRPSRTNTRRSRAVYAENDQSLADLSQSTADLSTRTAEDGEYDYAKDRASRPYVAPEYARIPWSNHGPGKLTVNLALWFFAMMSEENSSIEDGYKHLDTWRSIRGGYIHNTSGVKVTRGNLPEDAAIENGEDREAGDDDAQGGASMGSSSRHPGGGGGPSVSSRSTLHDITATMSFVGRDRRGQPQYAFQPLTGRAVTTRSADWQRIEGGWVYEKGGKKYFTSWFPGETT
ncbi:hypothetical protein MAPG_10847 [Magnaporthiopsis poae ATCC 64411]|uniref:Uncharacterized protein n=1 Tax=Magnaporthiopsis poae (strain ATCC 64411 / 73-15) TaxID=644358 RepID=A0A0C4EDP1_MAGP6|nr:hypothetical protein MAPG_10847 [Magnaporthiopsis poae ATCC 64411]